VREANFQEHVFMGMFINVIILTLKAKQFRCARLGGYYTFPVIKKIHCLEEWIRNVFNFIFYLLYSFLFSSSSL